MEQAEALKAQGNKALAAKDFAGAVSFYTQAIALDPKNHVFPSNRSAAHLSSGNKEAALADGSLCVELKPDWPKSYSRKGAALHALGRLEEAVSTYESGLQACPGDATLTAALQGARDALAKQNSPTPAPAEASCSAVAGSEASSASAEAEELPEWKVRAEELKKLGNASFKAKDYADAIKHYSEAIGLDPDSYVREQPWDCGNCTMPEQMDRECIVNC